MYRSFSDRARERSAIRYRRVSVTRRRPTAMPWRSTTSRTNRSRSSAPGDLDRGDEIRQPAVHHVFEPGVRRRCSDGRRAWRGADLVNPVPYSIRLTTESSSPVAMRLRMSASRSFSHADQRASASDPARRERPPARCPRARRAPDGPRRASTMRATPSDDPRRWVEAPLTPPHSRRAGRRRDGRPGSHSSALNAERVERVAGGDEHVLRAVEHVGDGRVAHLLDQARVPEDLSVARVHRHHVAG